MECVLLSSPTQGNGLKLANNKTSINFFCTLFIGQYVKYTKGYKDYQRY